MKYLFLFLLVPISSFSQNKGASPIANSQEPKANKNTYAVVVGISDYQDKDIPDLRYADKDAEAFANFLRSPAGGSLDGDHIKVLTNQNATGAQIGIALDWLMEVVREGDNVIIYFSGHGDVESKRLSQPGYLLGWDAPSRVYMTGGTVNVRDLQDIVSTLSVTNKARVVIITDACHSGKLSGSEINGAQLTGQNLARQFANEVKILSCQPNEYSIEGEQWGGGRGAFSYHLVNALYGLADGNGDLFVTLQEAGRYLEDHVTAEVAPVSQVPMVLGNRTERLASVDAKLLADLRTGRTNQMAMLSPVETRGMEDEVLAEVDTTTRELYRLFKNALKDKIFLEPTGACADAYYERLIAEPKMARLHSTLRRNYAAALQDDAQQVMIKWLKTDPSETTLSKKTKTDKYQYYPRQLERAAELLGKGHYMYAALQARARFFEGYLLALSNENPDSILGEKALAQLRQALHWQPDLPQAYWQMSRVFASNLLQPDSAEQYARRAMDLQPSWILPYSQVAFMFSKYKQFDRARFYLEQANKIDSSSIMLQHNWGLYYYYRKEYKEAEHRLKACFQMDSTFIVAYNTLGNLCLNLRRYPEAEKYFFKAIQLDSTNAFFYSNLGVIYEETQRYDFAEKWFRKAIQLDSTLAVANFNLGVIYMRARRYDEAERIFKKMIQVDSTIGRFYVALGDVYMSTGRYAEAEQQCKKAIQLDSTDAPSQSTLGYVYYFTQRNAEAEQQYKKAIQLNPNFPEPIFNLGSIYAQSRRYAEAEQMFNKVLQLDSTDAKAYANLAIVKCQQNHIDEALSNLEKALKNGFNYYDDLQQVSDLAPLRKQKDRWESLMQNALVPDTTDARAWNNLGQVYIRAGNYAPAEAAMRKAVALDATSAPFRSNLGFVYLNLGRYAEAEAALKKAIALDSTFANPRKHLGMVYFNTNRHEEARQNFLKAIALNPNYTPAMLGMAIILHSEGKTVEGIGYVEQAIVKGAAMEQLERDEDLAPLRATAEWKVLMQKHFPDQIKD